MTLVFSCGGALCSVWYAGHGVHVSHVVTCARRVRAVLGGSSGVVHQVKRSVPPPFFAPRRRPATRNVEASKVRFTWSTRSPSTLSTYSSHGFNDGDHPLELVTVNTWEVHQDDR